MLKLSLCNYSDASILVSGTITITGVGHVAVARQAGKRNKEVIFKNCPPLTDTASAK